MVQTEQDAKKKWCPMAGANRYERQSEQCLGSECMMWHWKLVLSKTVKLCPEYEYSTTEGYCGLCHHS